MSLIWPLSQVKQTNDNFRVVFILVNILKYILIRLMITVTRSGIAIFFLPIIQGAIF